MKNVLVIYYSQTGQAKLALDAVLRPFEENQNYHVHRVLIQPKIAFPFPWSYTQFFDVFPETVQGIPCELHPLEIDLSMQYDLIFIAYQPWFLSVCVPISSFLQLPQTKKLLEGKPVVTVINCRNMWLGAQEKMKKHLNALNAKLVGNITFVDHSSNLISLITVLAFVLNGKKEKFMGIFPKYGVTQKDVDRAPEYGKIIMRHFEKGDLENIQPTLNASGGLNIRGNLLLMEGRGRVLFPLYANYISKKGTQGSAQRKTRVRIFGIVLPTAILILSPIITIISRLAPILARKKFKNEIAYYSQNSLRG
ncbi:MAG: dialkylresorcinol condensing enzyme DarA [Bacteroidota bacterium]|jgi:hypothetical protein|nr:dialkylresorcinol condensing enzyme DarA [Bacteroidota bacterium]